MPIALSSIPPKINSVSSDIIFTMEAQPVDLNMAVSGATPFGLATAKFKLTGGTLPTIFVGQMIFCNAGSSPYYGMHVVTEIVSSTATEVTAVINTTYTSVYAPGLIANALDIVTDVIELRQIIVDAGVEVPLDVFARVKFNIRNLSLIRLNVSEYVRSLFLSGEATVIIGIFHPLLTLGSFQNVTTIVNATFDSADVALHYNTGSDITPKIMESAETLVFFKTYRTIWQENLKHSLFSSSILYGDSTYDVTFSSSFPGNKLSTQKVEIMTGCFKDPLNILYINSFGALRNYVVFNDIEQSINFENETRFKDDRLNEKILAVQSYEEYNVSATDVRLTHAESIAQMIASPKAWLMTSDSLTPIVINKKSFLQYRSFDAYLNFSFKFRIASTIQSQVN
jgi:hypothetical protein